MAPRKVIITCAVTGAIHTPSMSKALPVTPQEIADAAVEAAEIHADWLDAEEARFDPRVHARIVRGRTVTAPAYIRMMRTRATLIEAGDERLGHVVRPISAANVELHATVPLEPSHRSIGLATFGVNGNATFWPLRADA